MSAGDLFLLGFGALAVVFALLVLTRRQPMRAALALAAHMICLAAIFAVLGVHVVALFQVLIYVGAVMVFMVYTIMLLDDRDAAYRTVYARRVAPAVLVAAAVAVALGVLLARASPVPAPPAATGGAPPFGFDAFAFAFLQRYAYHFELATVLLLVGLVAAWTAIRAGRAPDGAAGRDGEPR